MFLSKKPITKYERHKRRMRLREIQKKQQLEKERIEIEQKRQHQENIDSLKKFKVPSLQQAFPCLFSIVEKLPLSVHIHFGGCPQTFHRRHSYLKQKTKQYISMCSLLKQPFFEQEYLQMAYWFEKEQRCKHHFLQLVQCWLYKRYKGRMLNTEDPVTLCIPKIPVYLFDIQRRGSYIFEATTLKQHMESELFYSEWLFPQTKHPKNPFTNLEFRECQRIHLISTLRTLNRGSWALEAYQSLKWDLERLKAEYAIPLKLSALTSMLRTPTSDETIEFMEEFIEKQIRINKLTKEFQTTFPILKWAVVFAADSSYIQQWRMLFQKYYSYSIVHGLDINEYDVSEEEMLFLRTIKKEAKELLYDKVSIHRITSLFETKQSEESDSDSDSDSVLSISSSEAPNQELQRVIAQLENGSIQILINTNEILHD
jgi:hypothetical protein